MSERNGVTAEELIEWLRQNAGARAGIYAKDGVIITFDNETGEHLNQIKVGVMLSNNKVSIRFKGEDVEKVHKATERFYIDVVDGGLDQTIEGRMNDFGQNIEIGDIDNETKTQYFLVK